MAEKEDQPENIKPTHRPKVGRPRIYKTVEEYDEAINDYFERDDCCFTITGLALALGFADKSSLYEYQNREDFFFFLKRARMMIEWGYEQRLKTKASSGSIFALKNFGWRDQRYQDLTTDGEKFTGWNFLPEDGDK